MSGVRAAALAPAPVPILFLDLDDVLCMSKPYGCFAAAAAVNDRHANPREFYRDLFVDTATSALKHVHDDMDAPIRYVVSSTWREAFTRAQLVVVFRRAGLGFVADNLHEANRWCTPPKFGRSRRVNEIAEWLDRHHQGEPFAIVNDTCSGASLALALPAPSNVPAARHSRNEAPHPFAGRVTLCQEGVGLTEAHVPFIVAALRRAVVAPGGPVAALIESETRQ